jgi:diamine N-acetyltransferase
MIDKAHQRKGLRHAAVKLLIDHVRTRPGAKKLLVSHMSEAISLGRFYRSLGFIYTGQEEEGEKLMALEL